MRGLIRFAAWATLLMTSLLPGSREAIGDDEGSAKQRASTSRGHGVTSDLPRTFKITWSDSTTDDSLQKLKDAGIQGAAKIVGTGHWAKLEKKEGVLDFSELHGCLEKIEKFGLWAWPYISVKQAPEWFLEKYPDSVMKNGAGRTRVPHYYGGGYVMSPWFVASGEGDLYLKRFFDRFLDEATRHPNVNGVFIEWLTFNFPLQFEGDGEKEIYFKCFDKCALASYQKRFGNEAMPPKDYAELLERGPDFRAEFERWYKEAAIKTVEKYLTWVGDRVKYKVIFVGRWGSEQRDFLQGYTEYQIKSVFKTMAKFNNVVENYEAQDNSRTTPVMAQWAKESGLIFGGENSGITYGRSWQKIVEDAVRNFTENGGQTFFYIGPNDPELLRKVGQINDLFPPCPYVKSGKGAKLLLGTHVTGR